MSFPYFKKLSAYDESQPPSIATTSTEPIEPPIRSAEEILQEKTGSLNEFKTLPDSWQYILEAMELYANQFRK